MAAAGVTLRPIAAADGRAVRGLFTEAQAELGAAAGGPGHGRAFEAHVRAALESDLADPHDYYSGRPGACFWVAEWTDRVIGMAAVDRWDGSRDTAELKRVAVASAHRRGGVAGRLVGTAERWAAGQGYVAIRLHTVSTMTAAISLYLSRGYGQTAEEALGSLRVLTFTRQLGNEG